jgi:hypothetical protein
MKRKYWYLGKRLEASVIVDDEGGDLVFAGDPEAIEAFKDYLAHFILPNTRPDVRFLGEAVDLKNHDHWGRIYIMNNEIIPDEYRDAPNDEVSAWRLPIVEEIRAYIKKDPERQEGDNIGGWQEAWARLSKTEREDFLAIYRKNEPRELVERVFGKGDCNQLPLGL